MSQKGLFRRLGKNFILNYRQELVLRGLTLLRNGGLFFGEIWRICYQIPNDIKSKFQLVKSVLFRYAFIRFVGAVAVLLDKRADAVGYYAVPS